MILTQAIWERMLVLLGTDTATFNQAGDALALHLFINDIAPSKATVVADFTEADFTGYLALNVNLGALPQSLDPSTGDSLMYALPQGGAWLWEVSGNTNLPQTVYGFYLTNEAGTTLLASERLATPVLLSDENQSVIIPYARVRQINGDIA